MTPSLSHDSDSAAVVVSAEDGWVIVAFRRDASGLKARMLKDGKWSDIQQVDPFDVLKPLTPGSAGWIKLLDLADDEDDAAGGDRTP